MSNSTLIIRNLVFFLGCISFFIGCGEQKTEAPVKPKVISQKITIKKESAPTATVKADVVKQGTSATPSAKIEVPASQKPKPADQKAVGAKDEKAKSDDERKEPSVTLIAYNSEGKTDPFAPLFSSEKVVPKEDEKSEEGVAGLGKVKKKKKKKRIPRTPLEKMDLGQLKLVAIIRAESGNKALVQDASGKGYVLNKGTYIGINQGFVTKIMADRVIVEEEDEDLYGKVTLREKELVLQKPRGEI